MLSPCAASVASLLHTHLERDGLRRPSFKSIDTRGGQNGLRTSTNLFRATRRPSSTHTGYCTFLHAILIIFNDFIHREINALGSLTLNGVVTRRPASCQHSYIGGGCPDSRSGTVGGEACMYVCRQHPAGAVISRPEERHVMLCLDLLCSIFFMSCMPSKTKLRCRGCYRSTSFTTFHGA